MNKFIEYLKNSTLTESDKNWKAIAQKFDTIEKVEILKDGKTIKVTGKKSNKAYEEEVEYKNAAVAKEVKNKLLYLIENDEDDNLDEAKKGFNKDSTPEEKADYIMKRCKSFRSDSDVGYLLDDADIIQGIADSTKWSFKDSEKYFKDNYKTIKINEAAVGQKGRTSYKEAMDYCEENEELVAEFRKIIKKLGGKTVAKALLDKLSQKPEIKDEIEHIEDIIDNSNY